MWWVGPRRWGQIGAPFELLHGEKKRMREVEEEDVVGSVHCGGGLYDYS